MKLFEPTRHEPLVEQPWDPDRADAFVARVVADAGAIHNARGPWPSHPDDLGPLAPNPTPSLYFGTAGVVWALAELGARVPDAAALLSDATAQSIAMLESRGPDYLRGLLLAPAGIHLVAALRYDSASDADALYALVRANRNNPVREFMWGEPGTLLAAKAMFDATREARWRDAYIDSAHALFDALESVSDAAARAWRQQLYGFSGVYLGAVHGFAGNIAPVIVGRDLLSANEYVRWREVAITTTCATALTESGLANWPQGIDGGRPGRTDLLMQICHGAPGMIVALGELVDGTEPEFDRVMLAGGELIWQAGPLAKGPGLCHGTAGNGYAFLRLYRQTQDARWLHRARAFAMH